MAELSAEAMQLLAQLRELDDPTPEERSSADAALRRTLEAHGLPRMPPLLLRQGTGAKTLAARSGGTAKLVWSLGSAVVASVGLLAVIALRTPGRPPMAAVAAPSDESAPSAQVPFWPAAPPEPAPAPPAEPAPPRTPPTRASARHVEATQSARSSLVAELEFLSSVDAEIRAGAYERALQRLKQNKGSSQLQEERAAMRVLALCGRDNDRDAARARAKFLKGSASSVLAERVRAACPGVTTP